MLSYKSPIILKREGFWTVFLLCLFGGVFCAGQGFGQCAMTCSPSLNLSLPGPAFDCQAEIYPATLGVSAGVCSGSFHVDLYTTNRRLIPGRTTSSGNRIGLLTREHIGQRIIARTIDLGSGNFCETVLLVNDLQGPDLEVADTVVSVLTDISPTASPNPFPGAKVEDCSAYTISFSDSTVATTCGALVAGHGFAFAKTYRRHRATDIHGASTSKVQVITQVAIALDSVAPPRDTVLSCSLLDVTNQAFGLPVVRFGESRLELPTLDGVLGEFFWNHEDEIFAGTGGRRQVLRSWRLYDGCRPPVSGQNPRILVQVISLVDTEPPILRVPFDTLFYSTNGTTCSASPDIPALVVTDNCTQNPSVSMLINGIRIQRNGGAIGTLNMGYHTLTYEATDQAFNKAERSIVISVRDLRAPVLLTRPRIQVAMSNAGSVSISARDYDLGSFDDCGTFQLQLKYPFDTTWREFIQVDCDAVGQDIELNLRGIDDQGNQNSRSVFLAVRDFLPPLIQAPANQSIDCDEDLHDIARFGEPTVLETCPVILSDTTLFELDECGTGLIRRIWIAEDASGNTSQIEQHIQVNLQSSFNEQSITWPEDFRGNICDGIPLPINMQVGQGYPLYNPSVCASIGIGYIDQVFVNSPAACIEVLRTWTVRNECIANGSGIGEWRHVQRIQLIDTDPPVWRDTLTSINLTMDYPLCDSLSIDFNSYLADDCSGDVTYRLFDNTSSIIREVYLQSSGILTLAAGLHVIDIHATDVCGNVAHKSIEFNIINEPFVRAVCLDTIQVALDSTSSNFYAELVDLGSHNGCDDNPLNFDANFTLSCANIGLNEVNVLVTDATGAADSCNVVVEVLDPTNYCSPPETTVVGKIKTVNGVLPSFQVDVFNQRGNLLENYYVQSGSDFRINVRQEDRARLFLRSNQDPARGLSSFDIYLIGQHILGVIPFRNAAQLIAADVNMSGSISGFDITLIRRVVLGLDQSFPSGRSYRFLSDKIDLSNRSVFSRSLTDTIEIATADIDTVAINSIKLGDVNAINLAAAPLIEGRSALPFSSSWQKDSGRHVLIYTGHEATKLFVVTLEVTNAEVDLGPNLQSNLIQGIQGQKSVYSWVDFEGQTIEPGAVLLSLKPTTPGVNVEVSVELVGRSEGQDLAEEYKIEFITGGEDADTEKRTVQVYPNPIAAGGSLTLLAKDEARTPLYIELFDARGKLLLRDEWKGLEHRTLIPTSIIPGIYVLRLYLPGGGVSSQRLLIQ